MIDSIIAFLGTAFIYFSTGVFISFIFPEDYQIYVAIFWGIPLLAINYIYYSWSQREEKRLRIQKEVELAKENCIHGIEKGLTQLKCQVCKEELLLEEKKAKEKEKIKKIRLAAFELKLAEIKNLYGLQLKNRNYLYRLNPITFEHVVGNLFKQLGYKVKITAQTCDGGKDAIMWKNNQKYLVECKRYNTGKKISREDLQKLVGAMVEEKAVKGYFVTTSTFSNKAIEYSKNENINLELINWGKLTKLIKEAYPLSSKGIKVMCQKCGEISFFKKEEKSKICSQNHLIEFSFKEYLNESLKLTALDKSHLKKKSSSKRIKPTNGSTPTLF